VAGAKAEDYGMAGPRRRGRRQNPRQGHSTPVPRALPPWSTKAGQVRHTSSWEESTQSRTSPTTTRS